MICVMLMPNPLAARRTGLSILTNGLLSSSEYAVTAG